MNRPKDSWREGSTYGQSEGRTREDTKGTVEIREDPWTDRRARGETGGLVDRQRDPWRDGRTSGQTEGPVE
jgi:hypothetical protein